MYSTHKPLLCGGFADSFRHWTQ